MQTDPVTMLATTIVFATGALWGLYWVPVRSLAAFGLPGAWGTLAITSAAAIVLAPWAVVRWRRLAQSNRVALASIGLGGAAFALYSVGLVYGRVAIIILLYFLTPVWSALIARYLMGWRTPPLRLLAIAVGLAGLAVMLSADGQWPLPRGAGEWMALIAGILWSFATTGIRVKSDLPPIEAAFVFALGAAVATVMLAPGLEAWPDRLPAAAIPGAIGLAFVTGAFWWALSIAGLMWATVRLEPTRVGILLMTEVAVGAASAAIFANEQLGRLEVLGGALVLCAGVLEVWPARRPGPAQGR